MKPLSGGAFAVVAFNRSPQPQPVTVTWAMLGVPANTLLALRDLWAHCDLGDFSGQWTGTVQPHDVVTLRAAPAAASTGVGAERT